MDSNRKVEAVSREAFLTSLNESGLLAADEVRKTLLHGGEESGDGSAVARALVRAGKLTSFQADAVLHRRLSDLRIGNYDVLMQLGKGGMGTVYKARHRRMKREVALKVLAREVAGQASFVQRFQREVETIAQLNHPNVVMAYDADEAECGHFLVMEFVNGRDLATEVQQSGVLSVAGAVECVIQAGRGLEYAHQRGIVHRDVKPANLIRDVSGLIKVADLGLARLAGGDPGAASLTQAGGIVGTVDYMPPEQAVDSTTIDQRADVYSLGCTLHFLLTAKPLYVAASIMGLLLQHRESAIPSLRDSRPDVPIGLDTIFAKAVAKSVEDRYQNMTEFLQALETLRASGALPENLAFAKAISLGTASNDATMAAESAEQFMKQETLVPAATKPSSSVIEVVPTPSEVKRVADLTIVLAEPSRTQAAIVRKYLQQLGIEKVQAASSGRQAVEAVKSSGAQVVLSALHLSDVSALQLAQTLRADPTCVKVGFVVMTSEEDTPETIALQAMSNAFVMPKPFDLRRLARSLALATGRAPEEILPA